MDVKKLEAIVKIEPQNPKHWFNLGVAYLYENKIAEAHKAFQESIRNNPYFAPSQFFSGMLLLYGRDFNNGIKYLEKANTIDENIYQKLISNHVVKEILFGLIKMSTKVVQDQLEFQPNNIENLSVMGKILLYTDNFESAINYFRKIIELKPDNWEAYMYLGISYEGIQNYEQAIFYLKRAIAINQYLAEAYWIMGRIYVKLGNYGLAMKNYEKAVELVPNNTRYLNSLAKLYFILDKNIQAIKTLQLAIDINPNSKWSYYYLGQCMEKELEFDIAIEQYEKAINIDPLFIEAKLALARLYQLNNNHKRAIEILEELSVESEDVEILMLLAQAYYSIENYFKSKEITEKLLNFNKEDKNAFYLYVLSLLNIHKKKLDTIDEQELIVHLEKVYNYSPKDPVISSELLKIYVDKREFLKAKEILKKSNLYIRDEEVAKRIALIYLQDEDYINFLDTVKKYNLFSVDFVLDSIYLLREKGSPLLPLIVNEIANIDKIPTQEMTKIFLLYLEYIYFTNTLQALEFYKQKFSEETKQEYKLYLFELLIYFTLYSEYKDKKYLDMFIELADRLNLNYQNIHSLDVFSDKINNTVKLVILFYFVILKFQYDLVSEVHELLFSFQDFERNVLDATLQEFIPILIENGYYTQSIQIIDKFNFSDFSVYKKLKIDALSLLNKNQDVLKEVDEYFERFSYDSYVDLIRIMSLFEIYGELSEDLLNSLKNIVNESNPLALAIYANHLSKIDVEEAKRYANRALEFLYTGRHPFKYSYQLNIVLKLIAKFFESIYQLSYIIRGLKQLVSKYPNNYMFNYLLARYLYITEDYIDAELFTKKAIKLAKNTSQLLEAQNLLSKIREDKEKYQIMINELEKMEPKISEQIAHINTLYKKDKIEEINKILQEIKDSYTLRDIILKFYISDKLELREQLVYYLYLLRSIAFHESHENLIELLENKLTFYSNMEEVEEIKQRAEMDYFRIFKPITKERIDQIMQTNNIKEEEVIEKEGLIENEELIKRDNHHCSVQNSQNQTPTEIAYQETGQEKQNVFEKQSVVEKPRENKLSLSDLKEYNNFKDVAIVNSSDLILAYLLNIFFIVFQKDKSEEVKQINQLIDQANIDLDEREERIVSILKDIYQKLTSNDIQSLVLNVKNFIQTYLKDKYYSFYISLILCIVNYKLNKVDEFKKYLKYCKDNVIKYSFLSNFVNMLLMVDEVMKVSVSSIEDFENFHPKNEIIVINNSQEYILSYFIKILCITFDYSNYLRSNLDSIINSIKIDLNDDEKFLVDFLKNFSNDLEMKNIKDTLIKAKDFLNKVSKNAFFSFYSTLIMVFISYRLNRQSDALKYTKLLTRFEEKYPIFKNLIKFLGKVGDKIENTNNQ
ncbi:MAG: tetratricopeptide repeat protein [Candidatus Calescibacterium sp.]|nr:tetratricopeptide repeat protein [Candidatus Calescibacterium sp.]MDW8195159.1 tetratricopeptide repeat protein [Candidatus Calescibacterium sp.]